MSSRPRQKASPEPSGEALFVLMGNLIAASELPQGTEPQPLTPDAFRSKAPRSVPGLFFWIGVEGLGQFQPTVRIF